MKYNIDSHITSIAHRGYSGKYEDNSHMAFLKAYECDFDMIELDIQVCQTGQLVIIHDIFVDEDLIRDLTLANLRKKKSKRGILTLKDFTEIFPYRSKTLYLDLKGDIMTAYALAAFIRIHNIDVSNMIACSFNMKHLALLKRKLPRLRRGFISSNVLTHKMLKTVIKGLYSICLHWSALEKGTIDLCKKNKVLVYTYTMDSPVVLEHMTRFDIDGIVTNHELSRNRILV